MILTLPGQREVDLTKVKDLSDDEFNGLISYAKQWDDPRQQGWVDDIVQARGGKGAAKTPVAPEDDLDVPSEVASSEAPSTREMTAKEVVAWVGDDTVKAEIALQQEEASDKPRANLVKALNRVLEA